MRNNSFPDSHKAMPVNKVVNSMYSIQPEDILNRSSILYSKETCPSCLRSANSHPRGQCPNKAIVCDNCKGTGHAYIRCWKLFKLSSEKTVNTRKNPVRDGSSSTVFMKNKNRKRKAMSVQTHPSIKKSKLNNNDIQNTTDYDTFMTISLSCRTYEQQVLIDSGADICVFKQWKKSLYLSMHT